MATPRKPSSIDVKGLSVEDIMSMDVNQLGKSDLQKVATRLMSAANKRLKRLSQTKEGRASPAYQAQERRGKKFSVKGKTMAQLKQEFANMRDFMSKKTSTYSGWRKVKKEAREKLQDRVDMTMTPYQEKVFWKTYHQVEELYGGQITAIHSSDEIQSFVIEQTKKRVRREDILNEIQSRIDQVYESEQQAHQEDFDIGEDDDEEGEEFIISSRGKGF